MDATAIGTTLTQVCALPHGRTRNERLETLAAAAKAGSDRALEGRVLLELARSYTSAGERDLVPVAYGRLLSIYDDHPAELGAMTYLVHWYLKWMTWGMIDNPSIPLATIERWFGELESRYRQRGYSPRPVLALRSEFARKTGDTAAAATWLAAATAAARDRMSDCEACERSEWGVTSVYLGDDEAALAHWRPVLDGERSCAEEPHRVLAEALLPLVRTGRVAAARGAHLTGYPLVRHTEDLRPSVALHVEFCALTGNEARGLEIVAEHASWLADSAADAGARLAFATGVCVLLRRLVTLRLGDLPLADGTVESVRAELEVEIGALCARYDARNRNNAVSLRTAARLAATPLLDRLPLGVRSTLPRPRSGPVADGVAEDSMSPRVGSDPVAGSTADGRVLPRVGSGSDADAVAEGSMPLRAGSGPVAGEAAEENMSPRTSGPVAGSTADGGVLPLVGSGPVADGVAEDSMSARAGSGPVAGSTADGRVSLRAGSGPVADEMAEAGVSAQAASGPVAGEAADGRVLPRVGSGPDADVADDSMSLRAGSRPVAGEAAEGRTGARRGGSDPVAGSTADGRVLLRVGSGPVVDEGAEDGMLPRVGGDRVDGAAVDDFSGDRAAEVRRLSESGAARLADRPEEAEAYLREALALGTPVLTGEEAARLGAQLVIAVAGQPDRELDLADAAVRAAARWEGLSEPDVLHHTVVAARAFHRAERHGEAVALFEQALVSGALPYPSGELAAVRAQFGRSLLALDRPREAAHQFLEGARLVERVPERTDLHADLAWSAATALERCGRDQEAVAAYHRAAELSARLGEVAARARCLRSAAWIQVSAGADPGRWLPSMRALTTELEALADRSAEAAEELAHTRDQLAGMLAIGGVTDAGA
ncbi:hypothetical protein [Nocardia asiatica]|uniref:hypothetical protein n=1 Tax=Nocardia asiatica TaxID=209252 RepID=UPI002458CF89|nr:hypothetical protein [Nocardia asiatica]